jgi:hypothetical protein
MTTIQQAQAKAGELLSVVMAVPATELRAAIIQTRDNIARVGTPNAEALMSIIDIRLGDESKMGLAKLYIFTSNLQLGDL